MPIFRLNITGIVAFVPDNGEKRVGVVVVDTTRSSDTSEVLYDDLVPHLPILKYRARDEEGAESPELLGTRWQELDIRGTRLYFAFDSEASELEADLSLVPPIRAAFEKATMDAQVLSGESALVHSQLALGAGRLFSSSTSSRKWAFKQRWTDRGETLELSGKSVWEVEGVERVKILLASLDDSSNVEEVALMSRAGADIELELSNMCLRPPERTADWRQMADFDFRWHYEVLDPDTKNAVREQLRKNEAPLIPYPLENPFETVSESVVDVMRFDTDTMCFQTLFPPARLDWPQAHGSRL